MADELMYNPNDDTQNHPFCRLQLDKQPSQSNFNKMQEMNNLQSHQHFVQVESSLGLWLGLSAMGIFDFCVITIFKILKFKSEINK